ncbi:hypothetical protein BHD05_15150 [Marisediminicola antarctica]|uniref:Uncharacterized protein n=1 Tax=Marisediminicola antarctica TaxID=674079 RepID=A0A7L5AL19_9MICO|nr:hypothetical protein BHD05_15150 [Marisediminicola antarctica]
MSDLSRRKRMLHYVVQIRDNFIRVVSPTHRKQSDFPIATRRDSALKCAIYEMDRGVCDTEIIRKLAQKHIYLGGGLGHYLRLLRDPISQQRLSVGRVNDHSEQPCRSRPGKPRSRCVGLTKRMQSI